MAAVGAVDLMLEHRRLAVEALNLKSGWLRGQELSWPVDLYAALTTEILKQEVQRFSAVSTLQPFRLETSLDNRFDRVHYFL